MATNLALRMPREGAASPEESGEALRRAGEYRPRRWSPVSLGLTALIQSIPVIVALWLWQPATVQVAPVPTLSVYDVTQPETPDVEPAPEPEKPVDMPPADEAQAPPQPRPEPEQVAPKIILAAGPSSPVRPPSAEPAEAAQPARPAPPRSAPAASSQKPADWQSHVLGRLNAVKSYPASARARRQQGVAMIRFTLDRRGVVLEVSLVQSSGFALLDREAVALPRRASPLPPPPEDMAGERIDLVVPVEFHF